MSTYIGAHYRNFPLHWSLVENCPFWWSHWKRPPLEWCLEVEWPLTDSYNLIGIGKVSTVPMPMAELNEVGAITMQGPSDKRSVHHCSLQVFLPKLEQCAWRYHMNVKPYPKLKWKITQKRYRGVQVCKSNTIGLIQTKKEEQIQPSYNLQ